MSKNDLISQSALARNLGISRASVRTLIDKGIFKICNERGMVSLQDSVKAYEQYQNTVKSTAKTKSRKNALKQIDKIQSIIEDKEEFEKVFKEWITQIEDDPIAVMNSAKAYLTALQTKEQKMKVDETEKRLIPIERIHHDAEEAASLIRSKLITIPSRVATICEGRSARDIEEIIEDEINSSLAELQKLYAVGE